MDLFDFKYYSNLSQILVEYNSHEGSHETEYRNSGYSHRISTAKARSWNTDRNRQGRQGLWWFWSRYKMSRTSSWYATTHGKWSCTRSDGSTFIRWCSTQALKQNKHKKKSKRISIWKLNCKVKTSPEVEVVAVAEEVVETHGCAFYGWRWWWWRSPKSKRKRIANVKIPIKHRQPRGTTPTFWQKCMIWSMPYPWQRARERTGDRFYAVEASLLDPQKFLIFLNPDALAKRFGTNDPIRMPVEIGRFWNSKIHRPMRVPSLKF